MNTYFDEKIIKVKRAENSRITFSPRKLILLFFLITLTAGLIIGKDIVVSATLSACRVCLKNLIPVLFPFMVISEIFIRCFSSDKAPLISAFLIGNVCGFPIGAKMLSDLCSDNKISPDRYRRYLPLCSNPGLAFTVVGVGANLWNSYLIGIVLYIATILSGILIFLLFSKKHSSFIAPQTQISLQSDKKTTPQSRFGSVFVSAVTGGTLKMLNVCGFVIFFSVFTSVLCGMFDTLGLSPLFSAIFCSFFEISGATASLSELARGAVSPALCLALTFFSHGFGGLCIYAQILSVSHGEETTLDNYLFFKLTQGSLCALIAIILILFSVLL